MLHIDRDTQPRNAKATERARLVEVTRNADRTAFLIKSPTGTVHRVTPGRDAEGRIAAECDCEGGRSAASRGTHCYAVGIVCAQYPLTFAGIAERNAPRAVAEAAELVAARSTRPASAEARAGYERSF